MKTATAYQTKTKTYIPYPNAATRQELLHKFVDRLLAGASCVACVTVLLFFVTLAYFSLSFSFLFHSLWEISVCRKMRQAEIFSS